MTAAQASPPPFTLAGLPLTRWFFALRVWGAMMLALYAAFWLELDGASSAATCVAILALPTRGQAFEKALYRSGATVVGVSMSIVISGLFSQNRDLFVLAYAGWLGLCVFGASLLDGNRAYGVVLSGYTVAIVSVMQVDSPGDVFSSGINRGAAIVVGIAAMALVNDLFAAPDLYPKVLVDMSTARRRALDFARVALRDGVADVEAAAGIFKAAAALHPSIAALAAESTMGRVRAAAARSTVVALIEEVMAARLVARCNRIAPGATPHGIAAALGDTRMARAARDRLEAATYDPAPAETLPLRRAAALAEQDRRATQGLAELRAEHEPERDLQLPLFRSRRLAARKGFRVGLAVALSSVFFVYSSWPGTSVAFALLGVVAALGSTTPSPRAFALGALVAMPLAIVAAGITEFVLLDGVDQFPLLALALAPSVIGACLMLSSPDPKLGGIGFLMLVFVPVILSPSNPQSYNPQAYLVVSLLAITAVLLLAFWLTVLAPSTDAKRRRWFFHAAADDVRAAADGRWSRLSACEAAYRSADRIAQLAALGSEGDPQRTMSLADAFVLADLEGALRRARADLERVGRTAAVDAAEALRDLDANACRAVADRLSAFAHGAERRAAEALTLVADLVDQDRGDLHRVAPGLVPA